MRKFSSILLIGFCLAIFGCRSGENSGVDTETGTETTTETATETATETTTETEIQIVDPEIDWIRVEPGLFTYGSPVEDTPCRGVNDEKEVNVTLTRPFLMAKTEITQQQWQAMGYRNPSKPPQAPDVPVNLIDLFEAAVWCNALSTFEGLENCYDLGDCEGEIGEGCVVLSDGHSCQDNSGSFRCEGEIHRFHNYYECPGYRLPTTAEWEYAAKAGTTTHTFIGNVINNAFDGCKEEEALEEIAWYCNNSDDQIHPVAQKLPNPWGFYDILGNVWEWVDYFLDGPSLDVGDGHPGEDLIDPIGPRDRTFYELAGGAYHRHGCRSRASSHFGSFPYNRRMSGFRPVKTIFEDITDGGNLDGILKICK